MTDNSPKAVYLRMLDAYNDGTPDSYGSLKFLDHFADDATVEIPAMVGVPAEEGGQEVFRNRMAGASAVFRNRHSVLRDLVTDGDRVVARVHFTATAAVDGPDWEAGAVVHNDFVEFCTVRGGKIVAYSAVIGPILRDTAGEQKEA